MSRNSLRVFMQLIDYEEGTDNRAMLNYSMRFSGHVVFTALPLQDPLSMFMLTTELIPRVPKQLAVPLAWALHCKTEAILTANGLFSPFFRNTPTLAHNIQA